MVILRSVSQQVRLDIAWTAPSAARRFTLLVSDTRRLPKANVAAVGAPLHAPEAALLRLGQHIASDRPGPEELAQPSLGPKRRRQP